MLTKDGKPDFEYRGHEKNKKAVGEILRFFYARFNQEPKTNNQQLTSIFVIITMSDTIINKVAESGLITIDLESFFPADEIVGFDLKDFLFMGLILKEKDFREALTAFDWENMRSKKVAIYCSADAIIPLWAYMLVSSYLQPVAKLVFSGTPEELKKQEFIKNIQQLDATIFEDKRVVVKGCGDMEIGEYAFVEITNKLRPVVKSLMYGEPCSTVPVYKKR